MSNPRCMGWVKRSVQMEVMRNQYKIIEVKLKEK
jgi:hypothetical protein